MKKIAVASIMCGAMATAVAAEPKSNISADQLHRDMVVSSQSAASPTSSGAEILIPLILLVLVAASITSGTGGYQTVNHY